MDNPENKTLSPSTSTPSAPVPPTPPEKLPAAGISPVPQLDAATQRRLDAAEQRARELAEQLRSVQAAKDREIAGVRKETKTRLAQERAGIAVLLQQAGVDAAQLQAYQQQREREETALDERGELERKAAMADAYEQQARANTERDRYIADECAAEGVDPNDPRLDKSTPQAFRASLRKVVRDDIIQSLQQPPPPAQPPPAQPPSPPTKTPTTTVSPLSGVSAGATNAEQELERLLANPPKSPREMLVYQRKIEELSDQIS